MGVNYLFLELHHFSFGEKSFSASGGFPERQSRMRFDQVRREQGQAL